MGAIFRNTLVASAAALTIAVGISAVSGAALARGEGRGAHSGFGLYIEHYGREHYGRDLGPRGYGAGLDSVMAAAYNVSGSYLGGDYSIYPYGSW